MVTCVTLTGNNYDLTGLEGFSHGFPLVFNPGMVFHRFPQNRPSSPRHRLAIFLRSL
jgi:hypothetical protein